jgi:hypothetical protein
MVTFTPDELRSARPHNNLLRASRIDLGELIDALVAAGCSLDSRNHEGDTVLHVACKQRDLTLVERLVERSDIDLDAPDALGWYLHHPSQSTVALQHRGGCRVTCAFPLSMGRATHHHHLQDTTALAVPSGSRGAHHRSSKEKLV